MVTWAAFRPRNSDGISCLRTSSLRRRRLRKDRANTLDSISAILSQLSYFGVQWQEPVSRLREALELMKLLWIEEDAEVPGAALSRAQFPVRPPSRRSGPTPVWGAANNDAIRRAASWITPG